MTIPILNIYYLLCYAWKKLEEGELLSLGIEDDAPLVDLFARVLVSGTNYLVQRGFDRGYLPHNEITSALRGRLDFAQAIKTNSLRTGRIPCHFDELSYDVLHNRILKSTIRGLVRVENLDPVLAESLERLYRRLPEVSDITITDQVFSRVQVHRNNHFYGFLMNVCELIHRNLLVSEQAGVSKFRDFVRDEGQMAALFEAFIRNFYDVETDFVVKSEIIDWQWQPLDSESASLLPGMRTDVTLRKGHRTIIIDCKYYAEPFQRRYGAEKLYSQHLYQISAYMNHIPQNSTDQVEGMLLYPTAGSAPAASYYDSKGRLIRIRSIDLGQNWAHIRERLLFLLSEQLKPAGCV